MVRTLCYDRSVLGGSIQHGMAHSFIELHKPLRHDKAVIHEGSRQARIKISGRNINNLRYVADTTLMAESEEELQSLLMRVKESERVSLRLYILKRKKT